jgi:hypothetical protein
MGFVSAKTMIAGKIYNADYSDIVEGADVTITCNGNVQATTSLSDGAYQVTYNETGTNSCNNGDSLSVYAEKGSLSGSKTGIIHDDVVDDWDVGIVNVPLIPEFGVFVGALTLLSAIGVFFVIRRK